MAKPFDPRMFLRQTSNSLLERFFAEDGGLEGVDWSSLAEHEIEPIFQAWQRMPEDIRRANQTIFRDVHEMANERGLAVLAEEITARYPQRSWEFGESYGRIDRMLWACITAPDAFEQAALFARADALASGRYWIKRIGLPKMSVLATPVVKSAFENALTNFYWSRQLRGRHCSIEHYRRSNGAEYFFAYLDDYPDKRVVFEDDGQARLQRQRYSFHNVFVYTPTEGALELYAKGGKETWAPLQRIFCESALGVRVGPADPHKPAYRLDHLLMRRTSLVTAPSDGVADARITRFRIAFRNDPGPYIEVRADRHADPMDIYDRLSRFVKDGSMTINQIHASQVTFQLTFRNTGNGRRRSLAFDVSAPSTCNLKSKPESVRAVGERCLRMWGVAL